MIARRVRARSGITLTEILISILIMGIGMISLAVLFPLGLLKLRDAARFHRSGLLAQSATDDFDSRALLTKESFTRTWYGSLDPFTSDVIYGPFGNAPDYPIQSLGPGNVSGLPQPGLPVCYDPYWRAFTNVVPINGNKNNAIFDLTIPYAPGSSIAAEARFGASVVVSGNTYVNAYGLRTGSNDGNYPSACGLQRITNFSPTPIGVQNLFPFTYYAIGSPGTGAVADTFVSADDIVFNTRENGSTGLSPLLPDLKLSGTSYPVQDFRYTWFFTGRQIDSTNGTMFQGDVVVCDGRQFGYATLPGGTVPVPTGETVVEGIFGYSENIGALGFAVGSDKTVLLRWPDTVPDPAVRIGGWIADVTYERSASLSWFKEANPSNTLASQTPFQRCNWYQVNKRTDAQNDPVYAGYRRMVVTTASPVKTKTFLGAKGVPVYTNAALVMPSVINVYPRAFSQ
jgi:hypothetical protein